MTAVLLGMAAGLLTAAVLRWLDRIDAAVTLPDPRSTR